MPIIVALCYLGCSRMPVYPAAPSDAASVRIPIKELLEKKPAFYTLHTGKNKINYFVVRLDGACQSYFDACGKCYRKKGGYSPDGDRVYCRTCEVNYSIGDLKEGIGSCYPIKLEGRVEGDIYVIEKKAIIAGEKYF